MMRKNTTTTATTATTPPVEPFNPGGLPPEYLDPTSRLFVPEELREHYTAPATSDIIKVSSDPHAGRYLARHIYRERLAADPAAWREVLDRHAARMSVGSGSREAERQRRAVVARLEEQGPLRYQPSIEEGDALERALTESDWHYGAHLRQLEKAQKSAARAQRNSATRAMVRASRTCTICGQIGAKTRPYAIGRVGLRPVSTAGEFQACPGCALAVQAALQERAAAEQVDGRTRGELAAQWLATGDGNA